MYLHLGNERVVREHDIVGIFDLDTSTVSKITRDFLKKAEKSGRVVNVSVDLPKTFVVCRSRARRGSATGSPGARAQVYISPISSATLLKRAGEGLAGL